MFHSCIAVAIFIVTGFWDEIENFQSSEIKMKFQSIVHSMNLSFFNAFAFTYHSFYNASYCFDIF